MKDELIGGIRNALERGETIEQAIQAFLNAGYSPNAVREAAALVAPNAAAALYGQAPGTLPASPPAQAKAAVPPSSSTSPTSSPAQPAVLSQLTSQPVSSPAAPTTQPLPTMTQAPPLQSKKTMAILIVALLILLVLLGITYLYSDTLLALFTG